MGKKKPIALTVYAVSQILIGLTFSILLLLEINKSLHFQGAYKSFQFAIFPIASLVLFFLMALPFTLLLSGIFILFQRRWAVWLNIRVWGSSTLIYILFASLLINKYRNGAGSFGGIIRPLFIGFSVVVMLIFSIWFFTRPKVKGLFKQG